MTREEAEKIPDLQINVTELVEDAFFGFRRIDGSELDRKLAELPEDYVSGDEEADRMMEIYLNDIEISNKALERWMSCEDTKAKFYAMVSAFKMIDNINKYGVACAEWCK